MPTPARGSVADPAMSTRWSPPLSEDFPSLFDRFAPVVSVAWRAAMGYDLDGWQVDLLRRVLEVFPEGHVRAGELRFRQVLISLPRQQGKSELVAALGILTMLARPGGYVVGIASTAEQAGLVYRRAMRVVNGNPALARRFVRVTETRGLSTAQGARWELKASKSAALQGLPVTLGIVDEVHLIRPALWDDLVNGTGGRPDTQVVGITTAGTDESELLKRLYSDAEKAAPGQRFGYFIWEAPEASVPEDDETLADYLARSNPVVACGRLDVGNLIADVRAMPPADAIHYRLNRFVSATSSFISPTLWAGCARADGDQFPESSPTRRPVFTIDRTPEWSHAAITATVKDADGILHTEVVASIVNPSEERLEEVCVALADHSPAWFVMDRYQLSGLGKRLERRGLPVRTLSLPDIVNASSRFYALVVQRRLRHASDPLLTMQIPRTARKTIGQGFRIIRTSGAAEIDAVMATVMGVHVAESVQPREPQLFV